ncbi:MAG: DUF3768 domain-containing protein [Rhizobiales bacterium]|nr:DUF3768 domain-containing protein [Hyphomicrobiales bacterium]
MNAQVDRIRELNDQLRKSLTGGRVLMTPGIVALGPESVERIVKAITVFDDFCTENDPYTEHDFGALDVEEKKVFFKIDYYDKAFRNHSPDPSDPAVTERVITLMLAEEY